MGGEHFERAPEPSTEKPEERREVSPNEDLDIVEQAGEERAALVGDVMAVDRFLSENKEVDVEKVEHMKRVLPSNLLEQLNQLKPGLLFELYVEGSGGEFRMNFFGNDDADQHIGLSQLLRGKSDRYDKPLESIKAIRVTEADGQEHAAIQSGVRGNFYETVGKHRVYQEVHDGYAFTVTETNTDWEAQLEAKEAKADRFLVNHTEEDPNLKNLVTYIVHEAIYQDVDPSLALSVAKASFGGTKAPHDFENKLQWTLRGLKEYESLYGAEHDGANGKDASGTYTPEFLAGLMHFPMALDLPTVETFFKAYGTTVGKTIAVPADFQPDPHDHWEEIETAQGEGIRSIVPYAARISSHFGFRKRPKTKEGWGSANHNGLDIAAPLGSPIRSYAKGKVKTVVYGHATAGNYVEIQHPSGLLTRYLHCDTIKVEKGQKIEKGDLIATVGTTGNSSGPHLHFEMRRLGIAMNPERYL